MVHMVGVDIGDDGDIRVLLEESPIAFIGFGDAVFTAAPLTAATQIIDFTADNNRRI